MEPTKPGSKKLPDFDSLNDRMIVEHTSEPMLVIKTNLDPKDSTEENPYYQHKSKNNTKAFRDYFEE